MRRAGVVLGLLLAVGCVHVAGPRRSHRIADARQDLRCKDGCVSPLLSILPTGGLPGLVAAGQLSTALGGTITTTRASNKSCMQADGGLTILGTNVPCVEAPGLYVEPAATNILLQSGNLGNVAWTPSTLTLVQGDPSCGASPDGTTATAWLATPTGGATDAFIYQPVTNGTHAPFAGSVWVKNPTGQTPGRSILMRVDGAGAIGSGSGATLVATAGWTRYSWTTDLTSDTNTSVRLLIGTNNTWTQAVGPFCLALAQLEQVPAAASASSSYIPTTAAAASRAKDVLSAGPVALNANAFSLSADAKLYDVSGTDVIAELYNGATDFIYAETVPGSFFCNAHLGGVTLSQASGGQLAAGVKSHVSCSYDGAKLLACVDGTCSSGAYITTLAASYTTVCLGGLCEGGGGNEIPGWLANYCVGKGSTTCR